MSGNHKNYKYGLCGPDIYDKRDWDYILKFPSGITLLDEVDLSSKFQFVFDQKQLGYCVMNAGINLMMFNNNKTNLLSRLFPGILCRQIDGSPLNEDCGTYSRTLVKVLAKYGTCLEELWPYLPEKFAEIPPQKCFDNALQHRIFLYQRILTFYDLKICLMAGWPFMMGIPIFESFESRYVARTGDVPMPVWNEIILGYHEIVCCAYSKSKKKVRCLNSYSIDWGDKGFMTLPYDYLANFVLPFGRGDCWAIFRQIR